MNETKKEELMILHSFASMIYVFIDNGDKVSDEQMELFNKLLNNQDFNSTSKDYDIRNRRLALDYLTEKIKKIDF